MANVRTSTDSFGTFLQTVQKRNAARKAGETDHLELLKILKDGDLSVPDLLEKSALSSSELIAALRDMDFAGLVVLKGDEDKIVKITSAGKKVVEAQG